jgi:serine/threonine protein kinase
MSQATPAIPTIQSRYRIDSKLGTGRLAVVYRAFDERLQRQVLVHMLRTELLEQEPLRRRFVEEAHASAVRSHQSLLEVFDSGEVAGRPFMITEYVEGPTLRDLGALTPEDALLYFRQVVGAVAACQAAGVPHPPISSRNLILVADGHVELLESWLTPASEVAADIAAYRAPERTAGQQPTYASAIYALGLLLFEMLTGRRAVQGSNPHELAQAHLTLRLPALSEVKPGLYAPLLNQLIQRTTARDPAQRPPDAAALGLMLDDLRRTINADTQHLPVPPVARPRLRERITRTAETIAPRLPPLITTNRRPPPADPDAGPDDDSSIASQRRAMVQSGRRRAVSGLGIFLSMLLVAFCVGSYLANSFSRAAQNVQVPSLGISLPELPDLGIEWPGWLTGVVSGRGEVLVVMIDNLNLRAEPGLKTQVIAMLPNSTQVRKIGGPRQVDNVSWYQVRARVGDRDLEGWVSANYVKPQNP